MHLNFNTLNDFLCYNLNNFYYHPSFLYLIGIHKYNIFTFFFRFTLSFLYTIESIFLFFLNKKYKKNYFLIKQKYISISMFNTLKTGKNFLIKITQSIETLSFSENILCFVLFNQYSNDFNYFKFLIDNKNNFLIKSSIDKIKLNIIKLIKFFKKVI